MLLKTKGNKTKNPLHPFKVTGAAPNERHIRLKGKPPSVRRRLLVTLRRAGGSSALARAPRRAFRRGRQRPGAAAALTLAGWRTAASYCSLTLCGIITSSCREQHMLSAREQLTDEAGRGRNPTDQSRRLGRDPGHQIPTVGDDPATAWGGQCRQRSKNSPTRCPLWGQPGASSVKRLSPETQWLHSSVRKRRRTQTSQQHRCGNDPLSTDTRVDK